MRSAVTFGFATLLLLPGISCAQEPRSPASERTSGPAQAVNQNRADGSQQDEEQGSAIKGTRRLETVTWNSVKHELTWIISSGEKKKTGTSSNYNPTSSQNYLISMDDATMTFNGEKRRFSKEEAANVHMLTDIIAKYAIDSTVWWDDGQGEPVDSNSKPKAAPKRRERDTDGGGEGIATLHVAAHTPAVSPEELDQRIRALEGQLAQLKRLQMQVGTGRLASY